MCAILSLSLEIPSAKRAGALDAGIIVAAQKVEHYEMAAYGSVRTFARLLGQEKAAELLQTTLDEESETNESLNQLAETIVNPEALIGTELTAAS
jgi:ferritin-like metal-binding protein YciE